MAPAFHPIAVARQVRAFDEDHGLAWGHPETLGESAEMTNWAANN